MSTSVVSASSRPQSERPSCTPTPSLGGRTTPSSLSSLLRPSTADTREQGVHIRHGVLPTYTFRLGEGIQNVLFRPSVPESVVLSGDYCYSFARGKRKEKWLLESGDGERAEELLKLLYASHHNVYVGICTNTIKLYNEQFQCYFEARTEREVVSAVYNESSAGEIITGSQGSITIWTFRQGGKKIAPAQIIEEGLGDSGSGPVSVLHMEDVPGRAQRCFAAVNSGIKVYQVCSGRLLSSHPSLHHCPLSSLLFFRPLTLLLSADTDGAIKVWDTSWRLCCTFIGHCEAVTALSPYPHGPLVISGSLDSTLRVWDLTSQDQVDCLDNGAPVRGLHTSPGTPHILTHSHTLVRGWRVQQLYKRSAIIGREILSLSSTTHPMVPRRLLASCADSAVRLVCPVGGHVITTALLPPGQCVHSLVHFPLTESLYVLEEGGTVTVFNTSQTPSPVTAHWTAPTSLGQFTCLAHYEQTMDEEDVEEMLAEDRWMGVVLEARKLSRLSLYTKDPLTVQREGMSLLLAGTNGGHIALIDHTTGDIQFHLKLHSGPVTLLACDAKQNYIFSASNDCQIFISKLHPHIQESISVMMSFDVTFCPSFICITPDRVGVACNNHAHSSFTIDMYCLQDGASFTGDPENGHQAAITGLVSFPRLHLFASTGLDRTLRIWTANNHPVRVLQLDVSPSSLVFSSPSAHLTLSLHRHLHSIDPSTC
jgi:WD40 repeat protein